MPMSEEASASKKVLYKTPRSQKQFEYYFGRCQDSDLKLAPTVVGSHMSLLRPTTPRLTGDRRSGKPGEVSEYFHGINELATR